MDCASSFMFHESKTPSESSDTAQFRSCKCHQIVCLERPCPPQQGQVRLMEPEMTRDGMTCKPSPIQQVPISSYLHLNKSPSPSWQVSILLNSRSSDLNIFFPTPISSHLAPPPPARCT